MKKLITICVGLIVAGCATTTQLEETKGQLAAADTKIQDLEKRLARIEGDLYRVEVKSAPKVEKPEPPKPAEPKFVPAKEVEKKVVDAKIDAFLKEYLGVQFGDSIDKFSGGEKNCRVIPVLKKFKYFNKAYGKFIDGKLYRVLICADIDKKFSVDSTREKIEQAFADLAVTLDLQSTAFNVTEGAMTLPQGYKNLSSYNIRKVDGRDWVMYWREAHRPNGFRRYGASITNSQLAFQLNAERQQAEEEARRKANATGETLPDPE